MWFGRNERPADQTELQAGPLTAILENGDLRYIRLRDLEVVRRIYVAVRDDKWNTIPGEQSDLRVAQGDRQFRVTYASRHRQGEIDYSWRALIEGSSTGTTSFEMVGVAKREFHYCRIGLCVLHPPDTCAGRPFRAVAAAGTVDGLLPVLVEPQRKENGISLPLFGWFSQFEVSSLGGVKIRCDFEGDLFGMEDQRNWTDASFKTYSTPQPAGIRHMAYPGREYRQRVTIRIGDGATQELGATARNKRPAAPTHRMEIDHRLRHPLADPVDPTQNLAPNLSLGAQLGSGLPKLGLGIASHGGELTPREIELLRGLGLGHLRVDLRLWEPKHSAEMARAVRQASALGCALELAIFVTNQAEAQLLELAGSRLAGLIGNRGSPKVPVSRVLVFREPRAEWETTPGSLVRLARQRLGHALPDAAFGGGTNGYFAELLRMPPEIGSMDVVAYTANPQVHANDEASLAENLATLATTVRTARSFCRDRAIAVSRLTLKPPFNQDAPDSSASVPPGDLPSFVDPRQMSLFGAAWTLGAIKHLAEAGASSVTLYETTGWAGLIELEAGCGAPGRFPSRPGMVFPMYHVIADLLAWESGGHLVECVSSAPLTVTGLVLRLERASDEPRPAATDGAPGGGWGIIVANLGWKQQHVRVGPFPGAAELLPARVRHLDAATAPNAMFSPTRFRSSWSKMKVRSEGLVVPVGPYGVASVMVPSAAKD